MLYFACAHYLLSFAYSLHWVCEHGRWFHVMIGFALIKIVVDFDHRASLVFGLTSIMSNIWLLLFKIVFI